MNAMPYAKRDYALQDEVCDLALDENGFLTDPEMWTEQTARVMAELKGIGPLQSAHWRVLRFVRDRYLRLGAIPPIRSICRRSSLSRQEVKALFGSCLELWRIAGLPDPGEEARAYMH